MQFVLLWIEMEYQIYRIIFMWPQKGSELTGWEPLLNEIITFPTRKCGLLVEVWCIIWLGTAIISSPSLIFFFTKTYVSIFWPLCSSKYLILIILSQRFSPQEPIWPLSACFGPAQYITPKHLSYTFPHMHSFMDPLFSQTMSSVGRSGGLF